MRIGLGLVIGFESRGFLLRCAAARPSDCAPPGTEAGCMTQILTFLTLHEGPRANLATSSDFKAFGLCGNPQYVCKTREVSFGQSEHFDRYYAASIHLSAAVASRTRSFQVKKPCRSMMTQRWLRRPQPAALIPRRLISKRCPQVLAQHASLLRTPG